MKSHARAVVIGGGIIGCNLIYHLTKLGWSDVVLIEKGELTSGSTWHAAGQVQFFAPLPILSRIQREAFDVYRGLEAETGEPGGVHATGGLLLAKTPEQVEDFKRFLGVARSLDIRAEILNPKQANELWPFFRHDSCLVALYTPDEGYADPAQTTNGLARAARNRGAEIYRHTRVTALSRRESGEWQVDTDKGSIACDVVVNCGGAWAAEISAMLGHYLPVVAFEHQYLITEDFEELHKLPKELPVLRDYTVPMYLRQERTGLMVGCFEDRTYFWGLNGIPKDFDQELLPPDVERCGPQLERTAEMVPILNKLGIRRVVNGPTPRSPDHLPLLGPAHGERGYYVLAGIRGGFNQGGSARYLAEWIVEGEPSIDVSIFDVRRFGDYATQAYTVSRLEADHSFSSLVNYPYLEAPAGRPARVSPLYARLRENGAVFGVENGWEVPGWYARAGDERRDIGTFGRPNWASAVMSECRAVHEAAGLADRTGMMVLELRGSEAFDVLNRLAATKIPTSPGEAAEFMTLNAKGGIAFLGLLICKGAGYYLLLSEPRVEQSGYDMVRSAALSRDVAVSNRTAATGVLWLGGPRSTPLVEGLAGQALSDVAAMASREVPLGFGRATVVRTDDVASPAWLLLVGADRLLPVYEALRSAGENHGLAPVGSRALCSLRGERARPALGRDIDHGWDPREAGLLGLVDTGKRQFVGHDAFARRKSSRRLVVLSLKTDGVSPWGGEPVLRDGKDIGLVMSGFLSAKSEKAMAFAHVPENRTAAGTVLQVELFGRLVDAEVAGA